MRLSRKLGYNGFIEMYYKLLGTVGGVSRGYEVNEDFVSHFAGKEAISLENYQNLRRAAEKICATPDTVFIYGMGFSSMMANYLGKKLLVLGIKCILSDGADSIGIFENNMESIGVFIAFFKIRAFASCTESGKDSRRKCYFYSRIYPCGRQSVERTQ